MRLIAVTGAGGFIGRHMIERLGRDGHRVRALVYRRPVNAAIVKDRIEQIRSSLDDEAALAALLEGVDAVVHLAGLIKARHRDAFFAVNAGGTRRLARLAARQPRPPKVVLVSSLAAREPDLSPYAASKRTAEDVLGEIDTPLSWTILRPPAVYGPGDRETLSFFQSIERGVGIMLGGEAARFSLLHVDDLAAAIVKVLEPPTADHRVLELDDGTDGGHSWNGVITAAERAIGKKAWRLRVPRTALFMLGHLNAGLRAFPGYTPMLTPEKVRELTHPNWVADNHLILAETTWRPKIPIDRGFSATVDWYRRHGWL